jgi:hypothetical protein
MRMGCFVTVEGAEVFLREARVAIVVSLLACPLRARGGAGRKENVANMLEDANGTGSGKVQSYES